MKLKVISSLLILVLGVTFSWIAFDRYQQELWKGQKQRFEALVALKHDQVKARFNRLEKRLQGQLTDLIGTQDPATLLRELKYLEIYSLEYVAPEKLAAYQKNYAAQNPQNPLHPLPEESAKLPMLVVGKTLQGKKSYQGENLFGDAEFMAAYQKPENPLQVYYPKTLKGSDLQGDRILFVVSGNAQERYPKGFAATLAFQELISQVDEIKALSEASVSYALSDAKGTQLQEMPYTSGVSGFEKREDLDFFGLHFYVDYRAEINFLPPELQTPTYIILVVGLVTTLALIILVWYLADRIQKERQAKEAHHKLAVFLDTNLEINRQSGDAAEQIQKSMRSILQFTGWPIGHIFLQDSITQGDLKDIWEFKNEALYGYFKEQYRSKNFMTGLSLTDRVLNHDQCVWVENLALDGNFTKSKMKKDQGILTAVGLPLRFKGDIYAVMEFFVDQELPHDEVLKNYLERVLDNLSSSLERKILRANENKTQEIMTKILDQVQESVFLLNDQGQILRLNQKASENFGYREKDIYKMSFTLMLAEPHSKEIEKDLVAYRGNAALNRAGQAQLVHGRRKGGSTFEAELRLSEIKVQNEIWLLAVAGDPKRELSPPAQPAAAMVMKTVTPAPTPSQDTFIAQESKLAFTAEKIHNALDALLKEKMSFQTSKEIKAISHSTAELQEALECLNDLARLERGATLNQDSLLLNEFLTDFASEIGPRVFDHRLEFLAEVGRNVPQDLVCDVEKLKLCLKMMINNALQYTTQGEIILDVQCQMNDHTQAKINFTLSDSGQGIDPETLKDLRVQLFEGKNVVDKQAHSIGLTLTYAKRLAQLYNGSCAIHSNGIGQGSSISISLLLPKRQHDAPSVKLAKSLSGAKLLLFDANNKQGQLLRNRLTFDGAQVVWVERAAEILPTLQRGMEQSLPFDRLILVSSASKLNLQEILDNLEVAPHVPRILLISDEVNEPVHTKLAVKRLPKPLSPAEPNYTLLGELSEV